MPAVAEALPRPPPARGRAGRPWLRALAPLAAAVAPAGLSLAIPWALAFDAQAWVVWGREILDGALNTTAGPSWKPLPVLLTTPFALAGPAAPALWLVAARAGGLLAVAGAFRLGTRLGGRWAGAAAAAALALSPWWLYNGALGNSEGLLAGAVLWALEAHQAGRPRAALALGTAAAILRPEAWPFLAVYGIRLWRADPGARRLLVAAAVAVVALWTLPDALAGAGLLGASKAARGAPSPGSAALASVPFLAVLWDAVKIAGIPAAMAAVASLAPGRRGLPAAGRLGAAALAWVALVAGMAQAGYAGNPRYLVAAAAAVSVLAGLGAVRLAGPAGAVVLAAAVLAAGWSGLAGQRRELASRAERRAAFGELVARAGGRAALLACSRVRGAPRLRSLIAWKLDLPMVDLDLPPQRPAVVIRGSRFAGDPLEPAVPLGFRRVAVAPGWELWEACGVAPQTDG